MLFDEADAPLLKKWIVKRLENTSDADADVLADYVLALLRHDGDKESVRALCEAEIPDFLKEDSALFVQDVFNAIHFKTYHPGANQAINSTRPFDPPTGPSAASYRNFGSTTSTGSPPNGGYTRKRPYVDRSEFSSRDRSLLHTGNSNESNKQPRRYGPSGGRIGLDTGREVYPGVRASLLDSQVVSPQRSRVQEVLTNSNVPSFGSKQTSRVTPDFRSPNPGILPSNLPVLSNGRGAQLLPNKERCGDYDVKGFNSKGNMRMSVHGEKSVWIPPQRHSPPDEYDPTNSIITILDHSKSKVLSNTHDHRINEAPKSEVFSREKGGYRKYESHNPNSTNRRGGRSEFSSDRPHHDKTKTTIVIENIPEEYFGEGEVRKFFSEFGNIVDIKIQSYRRLAIVKYENWDGAQAAYKSPKVIFNNRFVKVYWYIDQESLPKPPSIPIAGLGSENSSSTAIVPIPSKDSSEPKIDLEEFARKQQEVQEAHLKKQKKKQEVDDAKKELEKRQENLLKSQAEEKRKLIEKIAARGKSCDLAVDSNVKSPTNSHKELSKTEILKAQLAVLEAEALSLGIDTTLSNNSNWASRGRGTGRARGYSARGYRGSYRGGSISAAASATSLASGYRSFNLDNRPKIVSITGIDFSDSEKDENLRQHLLGIGEYENIEVTPERTTIVFKDRRTAEKFMLSSTGGEIPSIGKVEMTWVTTQPTQTNLPNKSIRPSNGIDNENNVQEGTAPLPAAAAPSSVNASSVSFKQDQPQNSNTNMDYDIAYDNVWEPE
ncbi:unnamed protein product [Blumeria hordei]|uniref:RRM domain-containing protein n=1 Tax=Blumeria hordei TaxID=2867405 RepID=A0A383UW62_BLUHO|nr:unnamed protein product [Blumeria hordei]